jgi:putative N6-adenine-specific DNA methylase
MMMRNVAPGMKRHFAAENFPFIPDKAFTDAKEEAHDVIRPSEFIAFASDLDEECLEIAKGNAYRAGVLNSLRIFRQDARTISAPGRRVTIVTNPPYGERLGTMEEVEELYRRLGKHFRSLAPWQAYIITSHEGFERLYGKRADNVKKLYNGMIPCYLYQYYKNNK